MIAALAKIVEGVMARRWRSEEGIENSRIVMLYCSWYTLFAPLSDFSEAMAVFERHCWSSEVMDKCR
jgi:hypothetical protein